MNPWLALFLGIGIGFAGFVLLGNNTGCCASLGKAGLAKFGIPDLGEGVDSALGGAVSALGLA